MSARQAHAVAEAMPNAALTPDVRSPPMTGFARRCPEIMRHALESEMIAPPSPLTINALIPAVSGLLGVAIGGWVTALNQGRERKTARIKQQLGEFYSPLIGIRSQIKAKSDVRLKVTLAAHEIWPEKFRGVHDPVMRTKISDEEGPAFEALFDYNNKQLVDEIVPLYRKMLDTFTDKMWLAEPSTIAQYPALVEFVELWNRHLDKSLPGEVVDKIGHKEARLAPFYSDLEKHFARLSKRLR